MDIGQALAWGRQNLSGQSEYPARDAALLLAHVLGCSTSGLYLHPEQPVTGAQFQRYSALIARRANREPIAYITGYKEFMGLKFRVDRRVLIPRPETEILVETCLSVIGDMMHEPRITPVTVCDVCCGSGAVGLSILKLLPQICVPAGGYAWAESGDQSGRYAGAGGGLRAGGSALADASTCADGCTCVDGCVPADKDLGVAGSPGVRVILTDISQDALDVAKQNAEQLGVLDQAEFLLGDGLEPLERHGLNGKADLIASNPPYIATGVIPTLDDEVKSYEPHLALDGGREGMYFIENMISQAPSMLAPGGYLIMEIGHDQADKCRDLLATAKPEHKGHKDSSQIPEHASSWQDWRFVNDYAGKERVLVAKISGRV